LRFGAGFVGLWNFQTNLHRVPDLANPLLDV